MTTPTPKDAVPFDPPVFCSGIERDCKHGQLARSCGICELEHELAAAQLARDAQKERADDLLEEYTKVKDSLKRAEARAEEAEKAVKLCASAVAVAQERIDASIAEGKK